MRGASTVRRWALVLALVAALVGCSATKPSPTPTPGAARPFTVMSTDVIRVTDPAAMTDAASATLATNVFQRLMTADPGEPALKPDAAKDCTFTSPSVVTCVLNPDLKFANGDPLTSSDVKFSIERAVRLDVPGSSASLLSSYRRIETPDDLTVRFLLSQPDTQFGWALASPAASIVDEQVYDADQVSGPKDPIVGSGPFKVVSFDDNGLSLTRFDDYVGRTPARIGQLVYRSVADSATIEDAMSKGTVDVVWRGLSSAAVTRFNQQIEQSGEQRTTNGFTEQVLVGKRVLMLGWSSKSSRRADKGLRQAIAVALQGDRTLDSVLPGGVPGHMPAFPLGGKATPKVTWKTRINLTLGYDPTAPNAQDIAIQVRTRLEDIGGLSVRIRPSDTAADLQLVDRKAWTPTGLAWLQPYLDAPLPASRSAVAATTIQYREATTDAEGNRLLDVLQRQAASDLVVLPISQTDEYVYARAGVTVSPTSYGPGWQLGLFGISNG